ncbi:MAG: formylglycine-generating enzyme family protein [Candidatus Competibacter sp.]|nr:formylglycine-generating enzyme family protein [Candidatus Competibacter sp.]
MNDLPRQKLRELIVQYGRSLCDDPRRCEALLKDYCGQYKREIFVLVSALKNRVAEDLINVSAGVPLALVVGRLIQRLEDELGLAENAARWAVESWALALGVPVASVEPPRPTLPTPVVERRVKEVEPPRPPVAPPASSSSPLKPFTVFRDRLRDGSDGPAMIVIPAGEFWMGSPESEARRNSNERWHQVKIERPFAIGRYAVTFAEYDRFCDATGRQQPEDIGWGRGSQPVININWYDAVDYTEWLSAQTGQAYRLPTEAEWEYVARAGTKTAFWWGDSITTDQANYNGRYVTYGPYGRKGTNSEQTVPVGQFQPNPWGLHQVHGNVWEWTGSPYEQNYGGAEMRYAGKNEGGARAVRGGSWFSRPVGVRSATRFWADPAVRSYVQGVRLARSL